MITLIETVFAVLGVSLYLIFPDAKWRVLLLLLFFAFSVFTICTYVMLTFNTRKGMTLDVNGLSVHISIGDLFAVQGVKVITFNEHFDTTVDDVIINPNSINGIFIDKYVDSIDEFKRIIENDKSNPLLPYDADEKRCYPFGCIKVYKNDYLLLSFACVT